MMRKITLIQFLFTALFFLGCSSENPEPADEKVIDPEEVAEEEEGEEDSDEPEEGYSRATFSFSGDYAMHKSSSEKTEESNDLFALQFYDVETEAPYAFVLGDDISQIKIDFRTGHSYMLKITYIEDGQNLISGQQGRWSTPFGNSGYIATELNKPYYSSDIFLSEISSPFIGLENSPSGLYVEIDRFHGVVENFEITEENNTLSVDLQRLVFGVTLNVEITDESVETIYFAIHSEFDGPREYFIPLTEGKGTLEIPFISLGFPGMEQASQYLNTLDLAVLSEYQEIVHISIGIPDHQTLFLDDFITVTRNTMAIIDLKAENTAETSNGNFTLNFGEEMFEQYIDLHVQ